MTFNSRTNAPPPAPAGGRPAPAIAGGAGKLPPGDYQGEVAAVNDLGDYRLVLMSTAAGYLHSERVDAWPPEGAPGRACRFKVGVARAADTYYAERSGGRLRARLAATDEPCTDWCDTATDLLRETDALGLRAATTELTEVTVGKHCWVPAVRRRNRPSAALGGAAQSSTGAVPTAPSAAGPDPGPGEGPAGG